MNCCELPKGIAGFCGVTLMLTSCAGVIVSEAVPNTVPEVAVTETDATETLAASPLVGLELLMVATVPSEVLQCTDDVESCVLLSV